MTTEQTDDYPVALRNGEFLTKEQLWELMRDPFYIAASPHFVEVEQSHIIGMIDGDLVFRLVDYSYLY